MKKPMVCGGGRGGQADQEGVEVFEHLPPEVVDRAVALIDDDEVERLDGDSLVVDDRQRLLDQAGRQLEQRLLFVVLLELLLALENRVEALDRRDEDLARRGDGVRVQVLDVVFLGELVGVHGLTNCWNSGRSAAQVVAVHEEQDPLGPAELDEPVAGIDGGEGLARSGRHLDQRPGAVVGERLFQVLDRSTLHRQSFEAVERRQCLQLASHLGVELDQPEQFLGPMEGEDLPAAGVGLEEVGELGDGAGGLVGERQAAIGRRHAGGRPPRYLADWVSTPVSVCPFGLASTTPMALPSA